MTTAEHPVHYATGWQIGFCLLLWVLVAVMCLWVTWGREGEQQARDLDALEERRRLNEAFSKDHR